MELEVQPIVNKFRLPQRMDLALTLQPDASGATADTVEALARLVDVKDALLAKIRWYTLWTTVLISLALILNLGSLALRLL